MRKKRQAMIRKAAQLDALRLKSRALESELQSAIGEYCSHEFGAARGLGLEVGHSPAYISDIRKGNRGLGDEIVRKISKLPPDAVPFRKSGCK